MNTQTLTYQIALTLIKGVGNITAKTLLAYIGNAEDIFGQSPKELGSIPSIGKHIVSQIVNTRQEALLKAEKEVDFILKNNIDTLFFTDKKYPFRLKECVDAPVMLYSKGNRNYNNGKFVGIVGTRKMTDYGKDLCTKFVKELAERHQDITIVSGLAYGVDICAHKTALECGLDTVGVLGHGLDRIYPAAHRATAVKMVTQGSILTEYLTDTFPDRQNFVQRNRIVAGMTDALLVVESGAKGGSLITAEIANSYNKDVFAFPGNAGNEFSAGCNSLIKQNKAALIESAEDFEKMMGWEPGQSAAKKTIEPLLFVELSDAEQKIMDVLKCAETTHINQLSMQLEMPMSKVSPLLIEMEFKGLLKCLPGNLYKVISYANQVLK